MDNSTIQRLSELDNGFYRDNAASFSVTRQHAWPGWERAAASLRTAPATVLDIACGNVRFKAFIESRYNQQEIRYFAVDSCPVLLPSLEGVEFQQLDIIGELLGGTLRDDLKAPACDLVACFGFMHHVPTRELRLGLMSALIDRTVEGGTLMMSFWQFADDLKLLEKAKRTTEQGCAELGLSLDEGDFLLGWNDVDGVWRYCHSFTDSEIDEFAAYGEGRAMLVDRFKSDGRTGEMNGYLIFRKLV